MCVNNADDTLFWLVTSCGILSSFTSILIKMFLQLITRETDMESNMRRQLCDLKAELGSVNMVDEFPKYAKIQRKISKISQELTHKSQMRSSYSLKVQVVASAAMYAVMGFIVLSLMWNYRNIPVVTLPADWLYPLGTLLAYPSEPGAISLMTWLIVTGVFGRFIVSLLS